MNTTLGDVLLTGVPKDPQGAGRITGEPLTHAKLPIADTEMAEARSAPQSDIAAEANADTKGTATAELTSKVPNSAKALWARPCSRREEDEDTYGRL